jgi:hypothetical protein
MAIFTPLAFITSLNSPGFKQFSQVFGVGPGPILAVADKTGGDIPLVQLYRYNALTGAWDPFQTITDPLAHRNSSFGANWITFSPDGNWLFISEANAAAVPANNSVQVYQLVGGTYSLVQTITGGNTNLFGSQIQAISNTEVLISGYGQDLGAGIGSGAVYYYTLVAGTWTLQQSFAGSDTAAHDAFGFALQANASQCAVLAPNANAVQGKVYLFAKVAGVWTQEQTISPAGTDIIADGITISASGNTVIIPGKNNAGNSSRFVDIYKQTAPNVWTFLQRFTVVAPPGGLDTEYGLFQGGIWTDDNALFVGASGYPSGDSDTGPGAVFVYQKAGAQFSEAQIINGPGAASPNFGTQLFRDSQFLYVSDYLGDFTAGVGSMSVLGPGGYLTIRFGGIKVYS